jgi:hypothetical protein
MPGSLALQISNVLHEVLVRPSQSGCLMSPAALGHPLDGCYMETSAEYLETSAQYREFAEECNRLAKQVTTDGHRKTLEEMAEAWRRVAAEADNKR